MHMMCWKITFAMLMSAMVPRMSEAALGGGKCNIPPSGSGYPGASTICTAGENGFCLIDHLTVTGTNPVTLVTVEGVCVCHYGYSGPQCATRNDISKSGSGSQTTTFAALTLGALGALYLSRIGEEPIRY
uniref:Uncharacterized protein LOC111134990 n=1 Tax=Crassostrea virginica TaxID=6565 RepID=A0A8B8EKF2_CRAVI|nr:uncharacterized protein LOC111134990 [Crassostrea virginica]